jgi:hypothetical protein
MIDTLDSRAIPTSNVCVLTDGSTASAAVLTTGDNHVKIRFRQQILLRPSSSLLLPLLKINLAPVARRAAAARTEAHASSRADAVQRTT